MTYAKHNARSGAKSAAKKYYKHWAESGLGKGNVLMEARGEKIVRQVEIYGTKMVWADEHAHSDDRFLLADQPVSFLDFDEDDEISAREFESAWKKAFGVEPPETAIVAVPFAAIALESVSATLSARLAASSAALAKACMVAAIAVDPRCCRARCGRRARSAR